MLEIAIADGGSTDGSLEEIERCPTRLRVRLVSRSDGRTCVPQPGLRGCRGTLIGWLNADDLYAPGPFGACSALNANLIG